MLRDTDTYVRRRLNQNKYHSVPTHPGLCSTDTEDAVFSSSGCDCTARVRGDPALLLPMVRDADICVRRHLNENRYDSVPTHAGLYSNADFF